MGNQSATAITGLGLLKKTDPSLIQAFQSCVAEANSILIGTHLNPDGDALGSALAVAHYLDGLGKSNEVLCHHVAPRNLRFLPGVARVKMVPVEEKHDLGIIVDLDAFDRLGDTAPFFEKCDRLIVIDHHVPHDSPGDIRIIDTEAPATAVIVTRLFLDMGVTITPAMATCLFTGVVTDTGSFRFRNTTPEALTVGSILLQMGADLETVGENIFSSRPAEAVRLLATVLNRLALAANDRIAWSYVEYDEFLDLGAKDEDTEGFVNELLSIDSVQMAALGRETKPGVVRVSVRSRGQYDVASVAREFGGGGHRNAAGLTFEGPIIDSMNRLIEALSKCLESS